MFIDIAPRYFDINTHYFIIVQFIEMYIFFCCLVIRGVRTRNRSRYAGDGLLLRTEVHIQSSSALLLRKAAMHDTSRCEILQLPE